MINSKHDNAEIKQKAQSKLEDKIAKIGGKLIPITEWEDNIVDDIKDERRLSTEIINGKVLKINRKYEISFAKFGGKACMVCYRWLPLSSFENYSECFAENWRDMYKSNYFAMTYCDNDIDFFTSKLKGFQVSHSEGF